MNITRRSTTNDDDDMAATVAQAQATDIASAPTISSPPHVQNVSHNGAEQAPDSLLPAISSWSVHWGQVCSRLDCRHARSGTELTMALGTFARVCLVRPANAAGELSEQPADKQVYALKILRKTEVIKLKQIDHVRHERAILAEIAGHPFITNLNASFSDHDSLYMLLDYVPGGELFSYLRKMRRFEEPTARFYVAEIVLVLEFLHEDKGGVAYRDLKPENLLLDQEGHIKLVDFGFAKRLGHRGDRPVETYTLCGTPEYLAPEVIQNKGHTAAVDWWALGILLYEFLTGYPPFWHQNPIEIYKQ